jgi:hypothetical protein
MGSDYCRADLGRIESATGSAHGSGEQWAADFALKVGENGAVTGWGPARTVKEKVEEYLKASTGNA